ncbi:uncharacterized protein C16orf86 homolog [Sorex fumeus]|uniref:uncharacterized protein C16orf86 homolog n=1 Tax=Sorex fumeus TaxID=62283 RepID=UPI0024AD770C|nr:uncharacterized protein C16orf86 homolog [Sorex fumeus]
MDAAEAERWPGTPEGPAQLAEEIVGHPQTSQCPAKGDQGLVLAPEVRWAQGEEKCPAGPTSEPEVPEGRLKLQEERLQPQPEGPEDRCSRPLTTTVRPVHGPKRKPVTEESEGSQSEPSPSAKQHKKAKKRKSLGVPVPPATASTVSAPSEALGLERKAQRLRPLYQYINYCNPELNQADEGDREAEAEVGGKSELALVPEEANLEQLQVLLPVTGELSSGLALPCPNVLMSPAQALVPLGEEAREEPGGLLNLGVSVRLKAEVDKSTQVDINKMLSVCAAPLVPPLSPQYK